MLKKMALVSRAEMDCSVLGSDTTRPLVSSTVIPTPAAMLRKAVSSPTRPPSSTTRI